MWALIYLNIIGKAGLGRPDVPALPHRGRCPCGPCCNSILLKRKAMAGLVCPLMA